MNKNLKTILLLSSVCGLVGCTAGTMRSIDYTSMSGLVVKKIVDIMDANLRPIKKLHSVVVEKDAITNTNGANSFVEGTITYDFDLNKRAYAESYDVVEKNDIYGDEAYSITRWSFIDESLGLVIATKTSYGDTYSVGKTTEELKQKKVDANFEGTDDEWLDYYFYTECVSDILYYSGFSYLEFFTESEKELTGSTQDVWNLEFKSNGVKSEGTVKLDTNGGDDPDSNKYNMITTEEVNFKIDDYYVTSLKMAGVESYEYEDFSYRFKKVEEASIKFKASKKANVNIPNLEEFFFLD